MSALRRLWPVAWLLLAGCSHDVGPKLEEFRPAQLPAGINLSLNLQRGYVPGNKLEGELLATTGDGVVMLLHAPMQVSDGRFRFFEVHFPMMRSMTVEQIGKSSIRSEGKAIDDARLERLRLLSRYPQGLSVELQAALLASYGESRIYLPARE